MVVVRSLFTAKDRAAIGAQHASASAGLRYFRPQPGNSR